MKPAIRKSTQILLLVFLALSGGVVVAQNGMGGPGMMGMGGPGMMGMGGPGMMGMGPMYMLNLSDAQRDKIFKINEDLHKQMWAIMSANMREHFKMKGQFTSGDKVDVSKMLAAHDRMYKSMRQMVEARAKAHNAMIDVLTKEQRDQLKNMRRGIPMGLGGGPRGGMPSPGMMMH